MYQIMISAGEASGDMHGASLLKALQANNVDFRCFGMGSDKLAAAGTELLVDFSDLAVMGYVEVLLNYRQLKRRLQLLQQNLKQQRPDILVLIDYASFNLKLAATARELGIPVLFYISPKIWASRPGRIKTIAANVSHMALIFPFELNLFEKVNVPATYVGNPLLDQIDVVDSTDGARQQLRPFLKGNISEDSSEKWVGLIPGSRQAEIRYNLPVMLEAAAQLDNNLEEPCLFLLPLADTIRPELVETVIASTKKGIRLVVVEQQSHTVMRACDALIVGSGTATLEAAVIGTPMVTLYVMHWLNYQIMRRLVISEFVTLVNIQAGKEVVHELIQHQATPAALAEETQRLLHDLPYREQMVKELANIRQQMLDEPADVSEQVDVDHRNSASSTSDSGSTASGASARLAVLLQQMLQTPS